MAEVLGKRTRDGGDDAKPEETARMVVDDDDDDDDVGPMPMPEGADEQIAKKKRKGQFILLLSLF